MADPTTANIGLAVPTRGSDVGTWDTPLNNDMTALDGYLGGVTTIALAAATTIALTTNGASLTPGAGPNQSSNSLIILSGTLTGNNVLTVSQPGVYRFLNNCTVGTSYVQVKPSAGTGTAIGLPDGEQWQVHYDGTNVRLVGLPHVGALIDLCMATTPAWMNAFSVAPYLLCNGATYTVATFPVLGARLGSTYGGNGVTTFGVPDFQNRYMIPMDFGSNNRITVAGAGIDGTAFGAAGGSQALQSHNHASPALTDPGHNHSITNKLQLTGPGGSPDLSVGGSPNINTNNNTTGITLAPNVGTTGTGSSGNIPPGIVGGIRFIKT